MTSAESKAESVEYIFTRRQGSEVERAHIIESHHGSTVETRCGLRYQRQPDFMRECAPDDLPELTCRNCKRSLRAHQAEETRHDGDDTNE